MAEAQPRNHAVGCDAEKAQERKRLPERGQQQMPGMSGETVPFVSLVGGSAMGLPEERHAALLGDPRLGHRANAVQRARLVSGIQRDYGNRHVQRIVKRLDTRGTNQGMLQRRLPEGTLQREGDHGPPETVRIGQPALVLQREDETEQSTPEESQVTSTSGPTPEGETGQTLAATIPFDSFVTTLPPVPCGPIIVNPSLRLSGEITASPTRAGAARVATLNLRERQLEISQAFSNEMGEASYEITAHGLALEIFDSRINLGMRLEGNTLEFSAPARDISFTRGDWTFEGSLAIVLALEIHGNPAIVRAVLLALSAAIAVGAAISTIATYGSAVARFFAGLGEAIGVILEGAGSMAPSIVPIIVLPGTQEYLQHMQGTGRGGRPQMT